MENKVAYHIQKQSVPYVGLPYIDNKVDRPMQVSDLQIAKRMVVQLRKMYRCEWCIWNAETRELVFGVNLFEKRQRV